MFSKKIHFDLLFPLFDQIFTVYFIPLAPLINYPTIFWKIAGWLIHHIIPSIYLFVINTTLLKDSTTQGLSIGIVFRMLGGVSVEKSLVQSKFFLQKKNSFFRAPPLSNFSALFLSFKGRSSTDERPWYSIRLVFRYKINVCKYIHPWQVGTTSAKQGVRKLSTFCFLGVRSNRLSHTLKCTANIYI